MLLRNYNDSITVSGLDLWDWDRYPHCADPAREWDDCSREGRWPREMENGVGATGDTSFQLVNLGSRFVDVKGTDDDEARVRCEIEDEDGDAFDDVFVDGVDVVFQLGRYALTNTVILF